MDSPAATAGSAADLVSARSAAAVTVLAQLAPAGPGLGVVVVATASLAMVPESVGSTSAVIVTVRSAPAASVPNAQRTSCPSAAQGAGATETTRKPGGIASRSSTSAAADGPRLARSSV